MTAARQETISVSRQCRLLLLLLLLLRRRQSNHLHASKHAQPSVLAHCAATPGALPPRQALILVAGSAFAIGPRVVQILRSLLA